MELYNEYHLYANRPRHHTVRRSEVSYSDLQSVSFTNFSQSLTHYLSTMLGSFVDLVAPYVVVRSALPFSQVYTTPSELFARRDTLTEVSNVASVSSTGVARVGFGSIAGFIDALWVLVPYGLQTSFKSLLDPSYYVGFSDLVNS